MTALDTLIEAVEADGDWIGVEASQALQPQQYVDVLRAYGEGGQKPSLDAALALHEALLPGWSRVLCDYFVRLRCNSSMGFADVKDGSMARAWLLAILRAYRTQQEPA